VSQNTSQKSSKFLSKLPELLVENILNKYNQLLEEQTKNTDPKRMVAIAKDLKPLQKQADIAQQLLAKTSNINSNQQMLIELDQTELELIELIQEEIKQDLLSLQELENNLLELLSANDPRDQNNIIIELRAGAGGDESALFGADLLRMYSLMADQIGCKLKIVSASHNDVGGLKEVVAEIKSNSEEGAFSWFKYEGGVHRVQRVPATEKQGRIHTSTVSVAVMPLIEDDNDFKLDMKEVEIIASTSTGAGGQSVNTTYSAILARHLPTGIEARSQDERNQQQNKIRAIQVLTSRVYDFYEEQRLAKETAERRKQVGKADRNEKIRTYNYPQDRITDHRYNLSWNQLPEVMSGKIVECIKQIKVIEAQKAIQELGVVS
jgi:peptide chain release factor 1